MHVLATSLDAIQLKKRGFIIRLVTWRAPFISPYLDLALRGGLEGNRADVVVGQGLHVVRVCVRQLGSDG
jgi:hypothetical protein